MKVNQPTEFAEIKLYVYQSKIDAVKDLIRDKVTNSTIKHTIKNPYLQAAFKKKFDFVKTEHLWPSYELTFDLFKEIWDDYDEIVKTKSSQAFTSHNVQEIRKAIINGFNDDRLMRIILIL
jgi:hypothetical protein